MTKEEQARLIDRLAVVELERESAPVAELDKTACEVVRRRVFGSKNASYKEFIACLYAMFYTGQRTVRKQRQLEWLSVEVSESQWTAMKKKYEQDTGEKWVLDKSDFADEMGRFRMMPARSLRFVMEASDIEAGRKGADDAWLAETIGEWMASLPEGIISPAARRGFHTGAKINLKRAVEVGRDVFADKHLYDPIIVGYVEGVGFSVFSGRHRGLVLVVLGGADTVLPVLMLRRVFTPLEAIIVSGVYNDTRNFGVLEDDVRKAAQALAEDEWEYSDKCHEGLYASGNVAISRMARLAFDEATAKRYVDDFHSDATLPKFREHRFAVLPTMRKNATEGLTLKSAAAFHAAFMVAAVAATRRSAKEHNEHVSADSVAGLQELSIQYFNGLVDGYDRVVAAIRYANKERAGMLERCLRDPVNGRVGVPEWATLVEAQRDRAILGSKLHKGLGQFGACIVFGRYTAAAVNLKVSAETAYERGRQAAVCFLDWLITREGIVEGMQSRNLLGALINKYFAYEFDAPAFRVLKTVRDGEDKLREWQAIHDSVKDPYGDKRRKDKNPSEQDDSYDRHCVTGVMRGLQYVRKQVLEVAADMEASGVKFADFLPWETTVDEVRGDADGDTFGGRIRGPLADIEESGDDEPTDGEKGLWVEGRTEKERATEPVEAPASAAQEK